MGFFSFNTQDTDRSISNNCSDFSTFRVILLDNQGNKWIEDDYEGYGVFGGKDIFVLIAEMNGKTTRDEGIDIYYNQKDGTLYPNLVESEGWEWVNMFLEECEYQGYFYPDEEEDTNRSWYNNNKDYDDYEEEW